MAAAVQRHGEDGRGRSLLVRMDGPGRSLGEPHGPAADGEGGGRVRAQAVEASKLHAAAQGGVGRVDPDVAHAGPHQGRTDCRVEAGICEGGWLTGPARPSPVVSSTFFLRKSRRSETTGTTSRSAIVRICAQDLRTGSSRRPAVRS